MTTYLNQFATSFREALSVDSYIPCQYSPEPYTPCEKNKAGSLDSSGLSGFPGAAIWVASIQQSAANVVSQGLRELHRQKYPQTYPFPCATPVSVVYEAKSRVVLPSACGPCVVAGQRQSIDLSRSFNRSQGTGLMTLLWDCVAKVRFGSEADVALKAPCSKPL
jgi:hypothetical protein